MSNEVKGPLLKVAVPRKGNDWDAVALLLTVGEVPGMYTYVTSKQRNDAGCCYEGGLVGVAERLNLLQYVRVSLVRLANENVSSSKQLRQEIIEKGKLRNVQRGQINSARSQGAKAGPCLRRR